MIYPITVNIYKENAALPVAKALYYNGEKIEAIKLVRQMTWLPFSSKFIDDAGEELVSLVEAKKFCDNNFIMRYEPKIGDHISYMEDEYIIKGIDKGNLWLFCLHHERHFTYEFSYIKDNVSLINRPE